MDSCPLFKDTAPRGGERTSIHDKDDTYTWYTAFTTKIALLNLGFAGHTDWRLPNRFELETLLGIGRFNPATDPAFNTICAASCTVLICSCMQLNFYWSSTTFHIIPSRAWFVNFVDGYVMASPKTDFRYVRAVRGGL